MQIKNPKVFKRNIVNVNAFFLQNGINNFQIGIGNWNWKISRWFRKLPKCSTVLYKKNSKKEQFHFGTSTVCTYTYTYLVTRKYILMDHKFLVFTLTSFSNFLVWCTPHYCLKSISRKRNLIGKKTKSNSIEILIISH